MALKGQTCRLLRQVYAKNLQEQWNQIPRGEIVFITSFSIEKQRRSIVLIDDEPQDECDVITVSFLWDALFYSKTYTEISHLIRDFSIRASYDVLGKIEWTII